MRSIFIGLIAGVIVGLITKSFAITMIVGIALVIIFFIGSRLLNPQKYILKNMLLEARKTTGKVLEKINYQCYDNNILKKCYGEIVGMEVQKLPKNFQDEIDKYLTCTEGLCYIIGLNHSKFPPESMVMRCIQFVTLIDKSLYEYGIKPCSLEKKIGLYKASNLYEAYLHDPTGFYTSENKKEELIQNNSIANETMQTGKPNVENIEVKENRKININARNSFPPSDHDILNIYNELTNTKGLTFEHIWDNFKNIQCLNDVILYEKIEKIETSTYSGSVTHFIDADGKDCLNYFSFLPGKAIDFLLFQLVLEPYRNGFFSYKLITDLNDIQNYKEILRQLKPDSNHAFLYGPYPYYYEKENIQHIQVFLERYNGGITFYDIWVLQGKCYEKRKSIDIKEGTFLV